MGCHFEAVLVTALVTELGSVAGAIRPMLTSPGRGLFISAGLLTVVLFSNPRASPNEFEISFSLQNHHP